MDLDVTEAELYKKWNLKGSKTHDRENRMKKSKSLVLITLHKSVWQ